MWRMWCACWGGHTFAMGWAKSVVMGMQRASVGEGREVQAVLHTHFNGVVVWCPVRHAGAQQPCRRSRKRRRSWS